MLHDGWLVLDLETTVEKRDNKWDNSPKNPNNKIVSAHYGWLGETSVEDVQNDFYYHKELTTPDDPKKLQGYLDKAIGLIFHNSKFDAFWLLEAGFRIPDHIYCTMIAEYILGKGRNTEVVKDEDGKDQVVRREISLKATAQRHDVTRKKSELVDELFKSGTGFEAMPIEVVREYAEADVVSCGEIYLSQQEMFNTDPNKPLLNIVRLMNEMTWFLLEIESNGCKIDMDVLNQVESDFRTEKAELEKALNQIVSEVMGDTVINLNSGQDMTKVVYSRQVLDREKHRSTWNIGVNSKGKPLMPPRMNRSQFNRSVRATTQKVYRTIAMCCQLCSGHGTIQKYKKNGDPWKIRSKCSLCEGRGAIYVPQSKVAGLKLNPTVPSDASINGFKTDKLTIGRLIDQAREKDNLTAIEFLTKIKRLNAINTYLDSFISGIQTWTRPSGLLHSTFNQCVTATGRLSSTNPNFQNLPKGNKFEVRRAIVSRFPGGKIGEMDFAGLEFRVAGMLSRDQQIIDDVLNGKDVHKQTASIILQKTEEEVTKDERSQAKAFTFQPLYGGGSNGKASHIKAYFDSYFNIYEGLSRWHKSLGDEVINRGYIQTPSGRQFAFPGAKRLGSGRVTNHTQVVNFPCQSFATADIVPLSCIRALKRFRDDGLKSKLILTVHDSIVVDIHPDEVDAVGIALEWAMSGVDEELKDRFNYQSVLPLDIEYSVGSNWMNLEELSVALDT